jgi:hypothetical protein
MTAKNKKLKSNGKEIDKPIRNEKGQLLPGVVLNPAGRPKGSLDFKTKFYNVVEKIAEQNDITPNEVEEQLMLVGYKKAKDGDYSFYRDLMDRVHGKPIQIIQNPDKPKGNVYNFFNNPTFQKNLIGYDQNFKNQLLKAQNVKETPTTE